MKQAQVDNEFFVFSCRFFSLTTLFITFFFLALFLINVPVSAAGTDFCVQDAVSDASAYSVVAADVDQDGNNDLVAALNTKEQIVWYKNNGMGVFGAAQIISDGAKKVHYIYIIDIDGDSDSDVLAALYGSSDQSIPGSIILYVNDKTGFNAKIIDNIDCEGAGSVYSADIDNDGDNDILSASSLSGKISWYENTGAGATVFEKKPTLDFEKASCVIAADIDNDNFMDIIASSKSRDKIVWFRNNGDKSFGLKEIISEEAYGSTSLLAIDIGGDAGVDIISASGGTGDGEAVSYTNARGDVISLDGAGAGQNLEWYENTTRTDGKFKAKQIIAPDAEGHNNVLTAANINDDAIDDLFYTSLKDGSIFFCPGKGPGTQTNPDLPPYKPFGDNQLISDKVGSVRAIAAADFDGDGDPDIAYAAYETATKKGGIGWYKNVNGYVISEISGNTTEDNEGTASFSIRLDTLPDGNVSIKVRSSDETEGIVSSSRLEFTPADWNQDKTIIVTGVNDSENDGDQTYKIILDDVNSTDPDYNGTDPDDLELVNIDNDDEFTTDGPDEGNTGGGSAGGCFVESCGLDFSTRGENPRDFKTCLSQVSNF